MKMIKSLLLISMFVGAIILSGCGEKTNGSLDLFAICLSENGAEMYGAYWCGHCKDQKEMFGSSFEKVNYIECTVDQDKCEAAGIKGYPTWKFADGSLLPGAQQFSTLAQKTGCPLP